MADLDIKQLLKDVSKDAGEEVIKVLEEHQDLLVELSKSNLKSLFEFVTEGRTAELDSLAFQAVLSKLTDEQFLALRQQTVEAAEEWAVLSAKKVKLVDDLVNRVGKLAANIIVKQILISYVS